MAVHLAVAGDVVDDDFFVLSFFPRDVLDEIWDRIVSVPENFSTYARNLLRKNAYKRLRRPDVACFHNVKLSLLATLLTL